MRIAAVAGLAAIQDEPVDAWMVDSPKDGTYFWLLLGFEFNVSNFQS